MHSLYDTLELCNSVTSFLLSQFHKVDEVTWASYEDKLFGDHPACVELLNELEMHEFDLDGVKMLTLIPCFLSFFQRFTCNAYLRSF